MRERYEEFRSAAAINAADVVRCKIAVARTRRQAAAVVRILADHIASGDDDAAREAFGDVRTVLDDLGAARSKLRAAEVLAVCAGVPEAPRVCGG